MIPSEYVEIMSQVSGIATEDIMGRSRKTDYCTARHIIWYRLQKDKHWSLDRIGRYFGRNHATVVHGIKEVSLYRNVPSYEEQRIMLEDYEKIINAKNQEI